MNVDVVISKVCGEKNSMTACIKLYWAVSLLSSLDVTCTCFEVLLYIHNDTFDYPQ